ncbi:MAG: translocation/assembly module TamB domain-containing protein, partial [Patescibacteria group bacterium]|nr:translocation/assembly module TamB domain-containing protein [Patescibacteria group bacterium]
PIFTGNCVISNGAIVGICFDEIKGTLTEPFIDDSLRSSIGRGNYYPQGIWASAYTFIRNGQYTLQGKGYLPFNKTDDIDFLAEGEGNFLAMLADISNGFFRHSNSSGTAMFRLAGPYDAITLGSCSLDIYDGALEPQSVVPKVTKIRMKAELPAGERFIKFSEFYGDVGGSNLSIKNSMDVAIKTDDGDSVHMQPLLLTEDGLTWGVMSFTANPKIGFSFSLPGLQDQKEWGTYIVLGKNDQETFYLAGPAEHPVVRGRVLIRNTRVTFPFLGPPVTKPGAVQKFLERINWDVLVYADKNVEYYRVEPSSLRAITDDIYIRVDLDNGGQGLWFTGAIEDGSFAINGKVTSSRGRLEFLDMNFRVQYINATFDKYNQFPEVAGRARTTIRDSTGIPRDVYAVIYSKDSRTGGELQNVKWENLKFRLVMDKPLESLPGVEQSQEDILRLLGYSTQDFAKKAPDVAGLKADNALFRPFLRPMERSIKSLFQLDQVDIRPNIGRNLTHNLIAGGYGRYGDLGGVGQALFQSSYLILGKYLSNDFYFTYTGQLASGYNVHDREVLGINHLIGVEYRVGPGILLQLEYDRQFNKFRNKEDTRFWIRRYFTLRD